MKQGFVITGTDTGVGKTVFAAGLAAAIKASYWKPVQAGFDPESDAATVARLAGLEPGAILPEVYRLSTPCSPHRAAEIDGIRIEPNRLALPSVDGALVVEGAGGVAVPLDGDYLFADQFAVWDLPVVIVARTALGTINHSLLTIDALRTRNIRIHGVAYVGDRHQDSEKAIERISGVRRLGRLPMLPNLTAAHLKSAFCANFSLKDFE